MYQTVLDNDTSPDPQASPTSHLRLPRPCISVSPGNVTLSGEVEHVHFYLLVNVHRVTQN